MEREEEEKEGREKEKEIKKERKKERRVYKIRAVFGFLCGVVARTLSPISPSLIVIQISHRSVSDFSAYTYVPQT